MQTVIFVEKIENFQWIRINTDIILNHPIATLYETGLTKGREQCVILNSNKTKENILHLIENRLLIRDEQLSIVYDETTLYTYFAVSQTH